MNSSLIQVVSYAEQLATRLSKSHGGPGQVVNISASQKSLLELIEKGDAWTVPALAGQKGVSRQHIQIQVNNLRAKGMLLLANNPVHKRSAIVRLTEAAEQYLRDIRALEDRLYSEIADRFLPEDLELTARTLRGIVAVLGSSEINSLLQTRGDFVNENA